MDPGLSSLSITSIRYPANPSPVEITAAKELAKFTGGTVSAGARPGAGLNISLVHRGWAKPAALKNAKQGWMWLRVANGAGEISADTPALLFAAVRLLARGLTETARAKLESGLFIQSTFSWHRPHWDGCYTQYWRSAKDFDPEQYVATLAEAGFTHVEVNGLQAHMPYEDTVPYEYYPQFYTYGAGFNHFVATPLTQGIWPAMYLDANLKNLTKLADLGRRYGLQPGVCMFEPRSMPERLFQRYPTLRGARVDHPFRSRLPRYCLAQDHPVSVAHYRAALQGVMTAVPDLSYMSVWTNDSGAGFEHTSSLYVGRNGGPYMIREWRNHDKIAAAAGESIVRFLHNLRNAAAEVNPDFDVLLRIEPFKVEHEHIKAGMGGHVSWEAPSMLVRGYSLPYAHPKYPEQMGVAGTIFQTTMDPAETAALKEAREKKTEPVLYYSASTVMNMEPLQGVPFPRSVHARLLAMHATGVTRASAFGGLGNPEQSPYWPNVDAIRAAQFFPETPIGEVLLATAQRYVGASHAAALVECWDAIEEAVTWQPVVPLFTGFGFCWQRTWDRPLVPDIEVIPQKERDYYEQHGCFQHNNPSLFDLGKDVLFDLVSREWGEKSRGYFDKNVIPRLDRVIARLATLHSETIGTGAADVFTDLRDRARGYRHWCMSLRNVCAWCAEVYGYRDAKTAAAKRGHEKALQASIDLELENTAGLIDLIENSPTKVLVVSGAGNNTFFYGEDLPELLRRKIRLTKRYRAKKPRIPDDVMWRATPGSAWPKFD